MDKLVFISDIATPQQIKFCKALQKYYKAHFFFYDSPNESRGSWWSIDLGENCSVLDDTWFTKPGILAYRYFSPSLNKRLAGLNPDLVVLGGFTRPSNYFAYRWAIKNNKKIAVITERSRSSDGKLRKHGLIWALIKFAYRKVHHVLVTAEDIEQQFRYEFKFGDKVSICPYAADLDSYFCHSARVKKPNNDYVYLYANRLTDIYNPIGAIKIFSTILKSYPESKLLMNASGELRKECESLIDELSLERRIEFLDDIPSWEVLNKVYERADILLFPATFSNGNFTILEAMASGMGIIISTKVLGIGKLIADGKNGFVCDGNPKEYLHAAKQFIEKPELFNVHKEINRSLVKEFTPDGVAKSFYKIMNTHN